MPLFTCENTDGLESNYIFILNKVRNTEFQNRRLNEKNIYHLKEIAQVEKQIFHSFLRAIGRKY